MIERTRALATEHGVALEAEVCAWEDLRGRGWDGSFAAVLCVGNSLAHAAGEAGRRAALAAMAAVLAEGGRLVVTSRNWERLRAARPGPGGGRRGSWSGAAAAPWSCARGRSPTAGRSRTRSRWRWRCVDEDGGVRTHAERMPFWPFRHEELEADLRAAGLLPQASTYAPDAQRYLVQARKAT